jgi:membrane protease YdiL (CAAX protease family)
VSAFDPAPTSLESLPERYPFWGYRDLAVFLGAAVAAFVVASLFALGMLRLLPPALRHKTALLVFGQSIAYAMLFLALYAILTAHYGRPFWQSLRWVRSDRFPPGRTIVAGIVLSLMVAISGTLLGAPEDTPMKDMVLSDWTSFITVLAVGVTIGPLFEEVVFRGFMQPLFVSTFGAAPGIVLAALPFGLLHLQQYGFNWQQGLLITVAGIVFGLVRHLSGSTRTATIMHAAYNSTVFIAVFANPKELPTTW